MKKKITSVCLAIMLLMTTFYAKASNLYVVSGEAFTITPQVPTGTTFAKYLWTLDNTPVAEILISATGVLTTTLTNTGTQITSHPLKLSVLTQLLNGCYSDEADHNIIVLPKLTTLLTADIDDFCTTAASISADITAGFSETLPADLLGIEFTYQWAKKTGNDFVDIAGEAAKGKTLTVTEVGEYLAKVSYKLPIVSANNDGASGKVLTAINSTDFKEIKKTLAQPITPLISIQ